MYDVTNFTDYIGRESEPITKALYIGGDTGKFAMFMGGIKGSTTIPTIDGEATLQAGHCKTPSGGVDVADLKISVEPWTFFENFCQDDLQSKFPNMVLKSGSSNADAPKGWEEKIIDLKTKSIQKKLELTYWQGDTAGTYTNFDGFIKLIDADGNAIDGNTSGANAITKANVIGLVDDMITASLVDVKENEAFVVQVGNDVFDLYISAQKAANQYHYSADHANGIYDIGGSGKKLMRVRGLNGTNRMFAGVGYDFVVGADVVAESETPVIKVWYDETDDLVYMRAKGKSGVQVANIDEKVEFSVVP